VLVAVPLPRVGCFVTGATAENSLPSSFAFPSRFLFITKHSGAKREVNNNNNKYYFTLMVAVMGEERKEGQTRERFKRLPG
jgi:hypothetical protein